MSNQVRVAMIGCGGRGKAHVPGFQGDPRVKIVALVDAQLEAAEAVNAEHGFGAATYDDHVRMLAEQKPEVVVICLWTGLHLPVFRDCVAAGVKAVLCEKPMTPTWGETLEMARLAEEHGVKLSFCHQRRFSPGNLQLRELVANGTFGEIQRIDAWCPPNLLDCGTHTFDQAIGFNGEVPAKWVLAAVDTSELVRWWNVPAESVAVGQIVFQNGVRMTFQVGGPDAPRWSGMWVYGSEGEFFCGWDGDDAVARRYSDPAWKLPDIDRPEHADMIATVKDIVDAYLLDREPELSYRKALRAAEIIFGCYESVRRRARVELPLDGFTDNPLHAILGETVG